MAESFGTSSLTPLEKYGVVKSMVLARSGVQFIVAMMRSMRLDVRNETRLAPVTQVSVTALGSPNAYAASLWAMSISNPAFLEASSM